MTISMNVIAEFFQNRGYQISVLPQTNARFKGVNLLPKQNEKLKNDVIYTAQLSDALQYKLDDAIVFCCCDITPPEYITNEFNAGKMKNIVLFRDMKLPELFNQLTALFQFLNDWNLRLYESLTLGNGMNPIFEIVEELKEIYPNQQYNFIHATDADFTLLGCTQNISCGDPVIQQLVTDGQYNSDMIKAFEKFNCSLEWEKTRTYPIVSEIKLLTYPVVIKTAKFNFGFVQIVMVCNNLAPAPGLIELFDIAASVLIRCYSTSLSVESKVSYPFHKLLHRLLRGEKVVPYRKEQNTTMGIPTTGNFNVFVISWYDSSDYKLERALSDFSSALPEAYAAVFEGQIVFLNTYTNANDESVFLQTQRRLERLEHVWIWYNAVCGVSSTFENLANTAEAYWQCNAAIECAHQINLKCSTDFAATCVIDIAKKREEHICYYDQLCVFDLFTERKTRNDLFGLSDCVSALKRLYEDDKQHHRDNCRILYNFLLCERSPSKTALQCNMHKNNVIYRMQRIESIIQCNLNDPETRFKFLLAYKYQIWFSE